MMNEDSNIPRLSKEDISDLIKKPRITCGELSEITNDHIDYTNSGLAIISAHLWKKDDFENLLIGLRTSLGISTTFERPGYNNFSYLIYGATKLLERENMFLAHAKYGTETVTCSRLFGLLSSRCDNPCISGDLYVPIQHR